MERETREAIEQQERAITKIIVICIIAGEIIKVLREKGLMKSEKK